MGHVERRASGAARGNARLEPDQFGLPGPAGVDAKQAWVISGWGVPDPLRRYNLAKKAGNKELVHLRDTFWLTEAAHEDASSTMLRLARILADRRPFSVAAGTADRALRSATSTLPLFSDSTAPRPGRWPSPPPW